MKKNKLLTLGFGSIASLASVTTVVSCRHNKLGDGDWSQTKMEKNAPLTHIFASLNAALHEYMRPNKKYYDGKTKTLKTYNTNKLEIDLYERIILQNFLRG